MPCGASQVHQTPLGQKDDAMPVGEHILVDLRLDIDPLDAWIFLKLAHLDLVVKMTDIAHNGAVLHFLHVLDGDDIEIPGRRHIDVRFFQGVLHRLDLKTFHRGLKRADGIDLGHNDPRSVIAQGMRATLTHIPVTAHHRDLASDHDVRRPFDPVSQRLAASVKIVELGLGDRIIHIERRKKKFLFLHHLIQTVHACCRLLGNTPDPGGHPVPELRCFLESFLQAQKKLFLIFSAGLAVQHLRILLGGIPQMDHHRGVPSVIHDQIRPLAVRPNESLLRAPPVFLKGLALPGKNRNAKISDSGRGLVLGRKNITARPADIRPEGNKRLDKDRSLDGHVKGPHDTRPLQRLFGPVFPPQGHQPGHFFFRHGDLLVPQIGQTHVPDLIFLLHHENSSVGTNLSKVLKPRLLS